MKALSIASILAIAISGAACSQTAEQEAPQQDAQAEVKTVAAEQVDTSGFNLGLPTDMETTSSASTSGFNLALPEAQTTNTDGFNLGTDLGASNGLAEVPEIGAATPEDPSETAPDQPVDDEPVIRLE